MPALYFLRLNTVVHPALPGKAIIYSIMDYKTVFYKHNIMLHVTVTMILYKVMSSYNILLMY